MEVVYSKIEANKALHIVCRLKEDFTTTGRRDVIDSDQFLQCATLSFGKGKTFRPHKHLWKEHQTKVCIAQESWVVIKGKVKCMFYDLDGTLLKECVLEAGDASFTLEGGHNYEFLEDDTFVYEYKTGPYYGQEVDKTFLDAQG